MNRLGALHCPDVCIELVRLFHLWSFGIRFENLLFDRRNRRFSLQSLRNRLIICQRSSAWLFASQSSSRLLFC